MRNNISGMLENAYMVHTYTQRDKQKNVNVRFLKAIVNLCFILSPEYRHSDDSKVYATLQGIDPKFSRILSMFTRARAI